MCLETVQTSTQFQHTHFKLKCFFKKQIPKPNGQIFSKPQRSTQPKTNINKGLNETFEWYKNNYKYFAKLNKKDILRRLGINK